MKRGSEKFNKIKYTQHQYYIMNIMIVYLVKGQTCRFYTQQEAQVMHQLQSLGI